MASDTVVDHQRDKHLGTILVAIVALSVVFSIIPYASYGLWDGDVAGKMGSWMSGIGAVFLQAAVIYLLYRTYRSQQEELQRSAGILATQSESMHRQRVDAAFFELLSRYDSAIESVYHWPGSTLKTQGRPAFEFLVGTITNEIDNADPTLQDWDAIRKTVQARRREFSEWIRSINTICSFLKREGGDEIDYYITIFRGYLSDFEMEFLLIELASRKDGSFTAAFLSRHDIFRYLAEPTAARRDWWNKMFARMKVHQANNSLQR